MWIDEILNLQNEFDWIVMTSVRRIVFNTAATYGRTVLAMIMGLFSSRWVLNALGQEDFGLYSVVGGLITFVGLLNGLLASSVGRYYAFAIGEANINRDRVDSDDLLRWFNSAVSIHWILPIILVSIGYPVGVYAIHNWLTIPEGREVACIWVFRLSLFTAFMNMVSVPYIAMYQAKQLIAELSLWSIITTFVNFCIAYMMLNYSGDRFIAYAFLTAIAPSVILGIQVLRAHRYFKVCRVRLTYLFDFKRLSKIFNFAFWDFFGWMGGTVRDQGSVFVINRYYGTGMNAAYGIAQRVISYTGSLSTAIIGALQPAITTAVGEGRLDVAKAMSFRTCKFSALMIMLFAIPATVEMEQILKLWLVNPPAYTAEFCRSILIATIIIKLGWGHHIAVCAIGKIAGFQVCLGLTACCGIPVLLGLFQLGFGPIAVGYMFIIIFSAMTIIRVAVARRLVGLSVRYWFFRIVIPLVSVALLSFGVLRGVRDMMSPSFMRIVFITVLSTVVLFSVSWIFVIDDQERAFVLGKFRRLKRKNEFFKK